MDNRNPSKRSLFWKFFWNGMASSALFSAPPAPRINRYTSDLEAMRGDWRRIGGDFDVAIREGAQEV